MESPGSATIPSAGSLQGLGPLIYQELREAARRQLWKLRQGETLDTTALVHEAYLKMANHDGAAWKDRTHFVATAAVAMRQLLVDQARRLQAEKHGGGAVRITLEGRELGAKGKVLELLAVNQALDVLKRRSPRLALLVELRFFGGLSVEETADFLDLSARTVKRDWRKARAVLFQLLDSSPDS